MVQAPMTLGEYKDIFRLRLQEIATGIGCHMSMVSLIIAGKRQPTWEMALAIEHYTGGQVSHALWYPQGPSVRPTLTLIATTSIGSTLVASIRGNFPYGQISASRQ